MPVTDLKEKLHSYIDKIEDRTYLEILNDAMEHYISNEANVLDELTPKQFQRLEESINQADNNLLTSHTQVMNLSKQWLTK